MQVQVFKISIMITGYLKDIRVSTLLHNGLSISLFLTRSHQNIAVVVNKVQNVTLLGLIEIDLYIGFVVR